MAQVQQSTFSISVEVDQRVGIDTGTFDQRVNTVLGIQQARGFDLHSSVYFPGGVLPPHLRLFFIRQ